jgi:hypothetical protein
MAGETRGKADLASVKRVDDNLVEVGSGSPVALCSV